MKEYRQSHVTLRLPRPLREWVIEQAKINDRTINGEIVFRLELIRLGAQQPKDQIAKEATGLVSETNPAA